MPMEKIAFKMKIKSDLHSLRCNEIYTFVELDLRVSPHQKKQVFRRLFDL
jgi:hypothetical protein